MNRLKKGLIATGTVLWAALCLLIPVNLYAEQSTNFILIQEQMVPGFGSGASATFVKLRGIVGHSGAGVVTSLNFILNFGSQMEVQPPGGNGVAIDVRGTIDDDNATVVVQALNSITATVASGEWEARGVELAEGPNTITVTATDIHGNSATQEVHVIIDTIPPARPTLKTVVTPTAVIPQALSGTKDPGTGIWLNSAEIVPVNLSTTWSYSLSLTQGVNPIDLMSKDRARNPSTHVKAQIVYDATPPTTPVVTDDGRWTASTTQLHAAWTSVDPESGITEYQYAIGTTAGGTDVMSWTSTGIDAFVTKTGLNLTEGATYYFSVKALNGVGLWSDVGTSDGITVRVDTTPPTGTVQINGGAAYTNTAAVTLMLSATDDKGPVVQMQFSNDNATFSNPEPFADTKPWTLASGDGIQAVYARFQDEVGNWSASASDTVILDTSPPSLEIRTPAPGSTVTGAS